MQTHFMYRLLGTYERFEKTATTQADILERQTENDFEVVRLHEKEKQKLMIEFSQAQNSSRNWEYLSAIANNITPMIPLLSGAVIWNSEENSLAGKLLVASGVAGIANRIFQSNGIYDKVSSWITPSKDLQETIASRLETGLQYASYVAGAAGGFLASSSGLLAEKLASWATTGVNIAAQGIDFGKSFAEKQKSHSMADVQIAESQIHQRFQSIQQTAKEGERLTHTIAEICEALKASIHSLYSRA
ncbi:MAG TPA: hypothetical protein VLE96_04005 [Chlamydiales bacterium]|nr:hypothetical protein [Chlamydiales bacterium]